MYRCPFRLRDYWSHSLLNTLFLTGGCFVAVQRDDRVDAYIEDAPPFAQPILKHLRTLVHEACPYAIETIKWGAPAYEFKGILAIMASMKHHAVFNLWKGQLIPDVQVVYAEKFDEAMGTFGKITKLADLPADDKIIDWIHQAMDLNERGVKLPQRSKPGQKGDVETPDDLASALESNRAARLTYEGFTLSKKREYVDWLADAKTATTRQKRLAQAVEWMAEGKSRNWKYQG
jgi:uncharacterized protein YdeI (YjbR/CyaY-like superfamily)